MHMPGWYDIKSLSSLQDRDEDEQGILKSRDYFHSLIEAEVAKGIPANRVVIGGFSQGGAMALLSGATYKDQLGGIFGLSCYLLLQRKIKDLIPAASPNQKTPIFMGHGDADQVVAHKFGSMSANALKEIGYHVSFNTYKYGVPSRTSTLSHLRIGQPLTVSRGLVHSADDKELDDLEQYLKEQIPPLGDAKNDGSL